MKINKLRKSEFGDFDIQETDGWIILRKFIDFETGMLIVVEQQESNNRRIVPGKSYHETTNPVSYIMISPKNVEIVEIEDRETHVSYSEVEIQDEELNISWKRRRKIGEMGFEYFEFDIYSDEIDEPIILNYWPAFSDKPHKPIPEWFIEYKEAREKEKRKVVEYQKKPYKEKVKFWSGTLHQQMRWNGESGLDEYAVFSKEWLEKTKKIEPLIEEILEDVIEKYWKTYWNAKKIKEALTK